MELRVDGPAGVFRIVGLGAGPGDLASVAWRDMDADGDLDVVVANRSSREVFNIVAPAGGFPAVVDLGESGEPTSGSRRGDNDNFGYGGNDPPPCDFFDNREADDHVFDYELLFGDPVDVWEHDFAVLGEPTGVKFVTWEMFSDFEASTIDFDGHTLNFATDPFSFCPTGPGGLRRVFLLTGSDAFIASDGVVMVTFTENGDDIALDRSQLGVTFA